jgi:hypothetical protein
LFGRRRIERYFGDREARGPAQPEGVGAGDGPAHGPGARGAAGVQALPRALFLVVAPNYVVTTDDVPWVARQLMTHGGRDGWRIGSRLCR